MRRCEGSRSAAMFKRGPGVLKIQFALHSLFSLLPTIFCAHAALSPLRNPCVLSTSANPKRSFSRSGYASARATLTCVAYFDLYFVFSSFLSPPLSLFIDTFHLSMLACLPLSLTLSYYFLNRRYLARRCCCPYLRRSPWQLGGRQSVGL